MSIIKTITLTTLYNGYKRPDTGRTVILEAVGGSTIGTATESPASSGQYSLTYDPVNVYGYWTVDDSIEYGYLNNSPFWLGNNGEESSLSASHAVNSDYSISASHALQANNSITLENEPMGAFGQLLFPNGNTIQLLNYDSTAISTITVPFATNSTSASHAVSSDVATSANFLEDTHKWEDFGTGLNINGTTLHLMGGVGLNTILASATISSASHALQSDNSTRLDTYSIGSFAQFLVPSGNEIVLRNNVSTSLSTITVPFATISTNATNAQNSVSSSYASFSLTASYALNGGSGGSGSIDTSSLVTNSQTSSMTVLSSSYSLTSSYALNVINTSTYTINAQSGSYYTSSLSDSNGLVTLNSGSGNINVYIPSSSIVDFPNATKIDYMQLGSSTVTFVTQSGVILHSILNKRKIGAQYVAVTAIKLSQDNWVLVGNLI